ncbi:MAG: peptidoglycan-associated lipoprotein Pal [Phenylobacterium sp.]|uniref:peptidoglycan-associated lipoprotein Pal n=1 Tax=Phenylobacterium sp. TaxID=1871053 RepID=UPI0025D9172F|nr:peptidoglycan-associated lipoprotein Pal [Phenylobacterium sp.]MBI1198237.1 peptidoglycan-associated lipoprotein Pal [Phenylobacterium sp.]
MPTTKLAVALAATLAVSLGACAHKPKAVAVAAPPRTETPAERPAPSASGFAAPATPLQAAFAADAGERVYFALDSHALDDAARWTLAQQAAWLARHPEVRALIAGNCDERGTREYNLALGARRAHAARAYLVAQGVEATRLETISYGKEKPLDPASTEEAWTRNRNAGTVVMDLAAR